MPALRRLAPRPRSPVSTQTRAGLGDETGDTKTEDVGLGVREVDGWVRRGEVAGDVVQVPGPLRMEA